MVVLVVAPKPAVAEDNEISEGFRLGVRGGVDFRGEVRQSEQCQHTAMDLEKAHACLCLMFMPTQSIIGSASLRATSSGLRC